MRIWVFSMILLLSAVCGWSIDPLTTRWTFGNHEPISMYERIGKRSTGGMDGNALWLEEWHHWFDSEECPALMESLGLNMLHCRFYKGMGWKFESQDFPNVQKFVENCHKHHVRVLAYIQFATLYYEIMQDEIPDLETWACIDENGRKKTYGGGSYFRWIPCETNPALEEYLKKMITIALTEGKFDGVMFDNASGFPCYCPRCREEFRKYLASIPNPLERFGIPTTKYVEIPTRNPIYGEIQDPIYQEWVKFRCQWHTALFRRLVDHAKKCKSDAIFTANIYDIRRSNLPGRESYDTPEILKPFDLILSQSGNAPKVQDDAIFNRVREMKMAQALGKPILALCDQDAGITDENQYLLPLLEDVVFGGIPTDRTILKPDRKNHVSQELLAFRRPILANFNRMVAENRDLFAAPVYQPVRVLWSRESIFFSEQSHNALFAAEEILLRNHVPYGLLLTSEKTSFTVPDDCELLMVPDTKCLSDAEIDVLLRYAKRGGKIIVTGQTGEYDSLYRQREENRLVVELVSLPNAIFRADADTSPVRVSARGWTEWKAKDGGKKLRADIAKLWKPPVVLALPDSVLTEWKRLDGGFVIHMVNYSKRPVTDARCPVSMGLFFQILEDGSQPIRVLDGQIPEFRDHAVLRIK